MVVVNKCRNFGSITKFRVISRRLLYQDPNFYLRKCLWSLVRYKNCCFADVCTRLCRGAFVSTAFETCPILSYRAIFIRELSSLDEDESTRNSAKITGHRTNDACRKKTKKSAENGDNRKIFPSKFYDPSIVTWFDAILPTQFLPYTRLARLDKPIGTMLLLWPCTWSIVLASSSQLVHAPVENIVPVMGLLCSFVVGSVAMRGAGCTVNDLWDCQYDRHVSRTSNRPLVTGEVTPKQALMFIVFQSLIGLSVLLTLQPHSLYCVYWGCFSLPLVAIYPAMKRFFWYPQLILGLTFNWGAILGWAAVHGYIDWSIVGPLYGSGVSWTMVYDTIYAHQDKKDDEKLQLHSTALTFGPNDDAQRLILHGFATMTWLQWLMAGYNAMEYIALPCYCFGVTMAYSHLIWQIQTADFNSQQNLSERFRSNSTTGAIVFGAIATSVAVQAATIV